MVILLRCKIVEVGQKVIITCREGRNYHKIVAKLYRSASYGAIRATT